MTTLHAAAVAVNNGCVDPANVIGAPDGAWTGNSSNDDWDCRWTLADPGGSLDGPQQLTVRCRKDASGGNGDPSVTVEVWEAGSLVATLDTVALSDATVGVDVGGTFDGAAISDATAVEVRVDAHPQGGSPAGRRSVQVESVTWLVTVGSAPEPVDTVGVGPVALTLALSSAAAEAPAATVPAAGSKPLALTLALGTGTADRPTASIPTADTLPVVLVLDLGGSSAAPPAPSVPAATAGPVELVLTVGSVATDVPTATVDEIHTDSLDLLLSIGDVQAGTPTSEVPSADTAPLALVLDFGESVVDLPGASTPAATCVPLTFVLGLGPASTSTPTATVGQVGTEALALLLDVGETLADVPSPGMSGSSMPHGKRVRAGRGRASYSNDPVASYHPTEPTASYLAL